MLCERDAGDSIVVSGDSAAKVEGLPREEADAVGRVSRCQELYLRCRVGGQFLRFAEMGEVGGRIGLLELLRL
jgi:hypothetical protein